MPQAQVHSEMLNLLKPKGILIKGAVFWGKCTQIAVVIVKTNF